MNEFRLILFGVSFSTVEFGSTVLFVFNCIINCCRKIDVVYIYHSPTHESLAQNYDREQCGNVIKCGITFHVFGAAFVELLR